MKLTSLFGHLTALSAVSLLATPALAAYSQPASTFSTGGGETSSTAYTNLGMVGQPAIVGSTISAGYSANHGFLSVLGDGFKILYPVIAATPGTLTFSVMAGTFGDQSLGISNTGGSTLAWTVSKGSDPNNIFSFTPATGTNGGSVTVTAHAASLSPGLYSNTLSISGAGISQTAQVLMNLTVTPSSYTLAVTLKLATAEKGGGTVTSTVPDSRLSCLRTGGTNDVTCQADFPAGSSVTLHQTPDSNTQWATWGAPGCGSDPTCQVVLNSNQGTDVTFPYAFMAKVVSNGYVSDSLVSAYGNAATSDTIDTRMGILVEGAAGSLVTLNSGKTIWLVGGLDAYYAPTGGFTTLRNVLKVRSGRLNVKGGIKVKP
jgi:hypothetical protein